MKQSLSTFWVAGIVAVIIVAIAITAAMTNSALLKEPVVAAGSVDNSDITVAQQTQIMVPSCQLDQAHAGVMACSCDGGKMNYAYAKGIFTLRCTTNSAEKNIAPRLARMHKVVQAGHRTSNLTHTHAG